MLRYALAKKLSTVACVGIVILTNGCNIDAPRPRMGTLPTPPPGPRFMDPNNLSKHSYHFSLFEKNGIVYTCKAGHIDVTHLRWNADYTRYAIEKTRETLRKKGEGFSFKISLELSKHIIKFSYPENWDDLSLKERERIAEEIAFQVGPYVAFNATVWHEILTWFGVHFTGFEPEFNSSFSWEDVYSNLLGTQLAVEAMRDTEHTYNEAMTLGIERELRKLGVQPRSTAIYASRKMREKWFTGYLLVDTIRKNLDIGLDDGCVTPILVPDICEGAEPERRLVPTVHVLSKYGFSMKYEIRPQEWERNRILRIVHPDGEAGTIQPDKHFAAIMDHIRKEAVEEYGYEID